jgi:hypothetical protein
LILLLALIVLRLALASALDGVGKWTLISTFFVRNFITKVWRITWASRVLIALTDFARLDRRNTQWDLRLREVFQGCFAQPRTFTASMGMNSYD